MPEVDVDPTGPSRPAIEQEAEVVVRAARVFAAVTAESLAQAGGSVTLPQLRVLTLASGVRALSNGQVAAALGVHISNASRICDRLVQADLLSRRDSPTDRRQVELTITERGAQMIDAVTAHRRSVFVRVLDQLSDVQRSALGQALDDFTAAAEEVLETPHAYLP